MKSMEGNRSGDEMYQDFMKLITLGSVVTFGDFGKLERYLDSSRPNISFLRFFFDIGGFFKTTARVKKVPVSTK